MLQRLRRRQDARRVAQADAEALIRDHGAEAYREARQCERDVVLPDGTTHADRTSAHWRRVALIVARKTGKRIGVDSDPDARARRHRLTGARFIPRCIRTYSPALSSGSRGQCSLTSTRQRTGRRGDSAAGSFGGETPVAFA
jgi:hypothetical protein